MRSLRPWWRRGPGAAGLCGTFAAALLAASPALAGAPQARLVEGDVALEYRRGRNTASCPGEAALRERSADAFDFRDPFVPSGATATARMRIEVTREPKVYRAVITILDAAGETAAVSREQHVDCDALVWVLAHRIALAVLRRPAPASPPRSAPPPDPVPPPAVPAPPAPPPPAAPAPPPRPCDDRCLADLVRRMSAERVRLPELSGSVGAGGLVTLGFAAEPGMGFFVRSGFQRRSFSLWAEARGALPATAMTYAPGVQSTISTISALVSPCMRRSIFLGCLFVEAAVLLYGLPRSNTIVRAGFDLGPRVGVDLPIGHGFHIEAFADVSVRPYLPTFSVVLTGIEDEGTRSTWVPPYVNGTVSLGLFWSG